MTTASQLTTVLDDASDIRRLHEICISHSKDQTNPQTLRRGTHKCTTITHSSHAKWIRVLRQLHTTLRSTDRGALLLDNILHQERRLSYTEKSVITGLQAVAAIHYDQELCGYVSSVREATGTEFGDVVPQDGVVQLTPVIPALLEHMLLVDYGIGVRPLRQPCFMPSWMFLRLLWPAVNGYCEYLTKFASYCKQGQFPAQEGWDYLSFRLKVFQSHDPADLALMLYYYHTHRQPLDRTDYEKGMTGYTGILNELVAEVPTRGTERLLHKLSVDVNELIPRVVSEPRDRQRMISIAEDIAAQHGICLYAFGPDSVAQPLSETADTGKPPGRKEGGWGETFRTFLAQPAGLFVKEKVKVE